MAGRSATSEPLASAEAVDFRMLIIEDQLIKGGGAVTLGKSAGLSEPGRAAALHWPRDAHGIDAADAGVALDCRCLV